MPVLILLDAAVNSRQFLQDFLIPLDSGWYLVTSICVLLLSSSSSTSSLKLVFPLTRLFHG